MIKEKALGVKNIDRANDGIRMAITRRPVRWNENYKYQIDTWVRDLGPTEEILSKYEQDEIYSEFRSAYISQIKNNKESREAYDKLCEQAKNETVTLLCYKKDGRNCHRFILKQLVENPAMLSVG